MKRIPEIEIIVHVETDDPNDLPEPTKPNLAPTELDIHVSSRAYRDWIEEHYHQRILEMAEKFGIQEIKYVPDDEGA
jgi:hypothetical protein